jgi:hypothetical protein
MANTQPKLRHVLLMKVGKGYESPAREGWQKHIAGWNELPTDVEPESIEWLILDGDLRGLPTPVEAMRRLPNLKQLGTERELLGFAPSDLPNLEELLVLGDPKVQLPRGPWPKLRWLMVNDGQASIEDATEYPALEELEIRTTGAKKVFAEIAKLPKLRKLAIGPVKNADALSALEPLAFGALRELSLSRGGIDSLEAVTRFSKLTGFGAVNCHSFTDLGPLANMVALEEVWFNFCAGIKKASALLELPNLKRVRLWGCRENGPELKRVCAKLAARGVAVDSEID